MVSVVMATYNGEKFVKAQLESILRQSRKPEEIVICDDNSNDKTVDIINAVKNTTNIPIYIYINGKRKGYAQNFRCAISKSRGDFVFLCDQDDVWFEDKILRCMNVFERKNEVLALSTGYYLTDAALCRQKPSSPLKAGKMLKIPWKKFIRHPKYPGMSMAFRKKIWSDIDALDWKSKAPHDWLINQYAAAANGMYLLGDKLVLYRQHGENAEGVLMNEQNHNIRSSRLRQIGELMDAMQTICPESSDKVIYIKNMMLFQSHRKYILKTGNTLQLLIYELFNIKYISLRSVLGDLYVCIKSRKEKYV